MIADQVGKLVNVVESHDYHEATVELRPFSGDFVSRRFAEVEIECKQRGNEIVFEILCPVADRRRHVYFVKQAEKGLLGIKRRSDAMAGAQRFALSRLDADCATVFNQNAPWSVKVMIAPPASRTVLSRARASAAEPPRDICAFDG